MAIRHVRQREYRKKRMELEACLTKDRLSKTDRILLIISKFEPSVVEEKRGSKASTGKKKKGNNYYAEFGISAHGREKRKGKSMAPKDIS